MFVVMLHYVQPVEAVDRHIEAHRAYLDRHYAAGDFIASGPQVPRIGGVILANVASREALDAVLEEDPFYREGVAQYQVIEFTPTKHAPAMAALIGAPR
jgi:uncharacterized protein YciI